MDYSILLLFIVAIATVFYISLRIKEKYEEEDPKLGELRAKLQHVFPELDNVILLRGTKSYTINKKRIYLCLKDKNGEYYDTNMLTYVILHELAHVLCHEIGHTTLFHQTFKSLLEKAEHYDLYNPDIPIIKDYCEYSS